MSGILAERSYGYLELKEPKKTLDMKDEITQQIDLTHNTWLHAWIPLDWARGLVRVGVQSAIAHPEAEKLLVKLMTERGLKIPPPPTSSICLTKGLKGCQ